MLRSAALAVVSAAASALGTQAPSASPQSPGANKTVGCNKTVGEEYPPPGEEEDIAWFSARNVARGAAQFPKEVVRGNHGKTNACARAKWVVDDDVPSDLQVGIFEKGRTYDGWVRFSNGQSDSKEGDDRDPDVRGLALKLLNVPGEKNLPDAENTQDLLFISSFANAFFTPDVHMYTCLAQGCIATCATCLAAAEEIKSQYKVPNPLNITYGTLANYILETSSGAVGIKYWMEPCDPSKTVPSTDKTNGGPDVNRNAQRDAVAEQLSPTDGQEVCMQFGVQLQQDACEQPMEDASVVWTTPRVKVAKLTFPLQHVSNSNAFTLCENLDFNVWHGLKVHRPAGGVSRARKQIYRDSASNRHNLNGGGCMQVEPASACLKNITEMLAPAAECPFSAAAMRTEAPARSAAPTSVVASDSGESPLPPGIVALIIILALAVPAAAFCGFKLAQRQQADKRGVARVGSQQEPGVYTGMDTKVAE